ncbi:MAG: hypothetical protein UY72_C0044G0012 [Candidatus Uhrbacteria bacterium GW2011_GWD2_52_7]|uniref:Uncharacterized protein n=1 Tax=Candidatus Uhrbacteria bacterium GW2011_GWD2_52_7 TaxID=1618989 RepID=A0A0G1XEX5_9BACT|nr:MAG: hypothetical protein UY72_C0044G0012 [Candidatus Uhrbacteria bacterium GW2011_GWD2_52_7]
MQDEHDVATLISEVLLGNNFARPHLIKCRKKLEEDLWRFSEEACRVDFYLACIDLVLYVTEAENEDVVHQRSMLVITRIRAFLGVSVWNRTSDSFALVIRTLDKKVPTFSKTYREMVGLPK